MVISCAKTKKNKEIKGTFSEYKSEWLDFYWYLDMYYKMIFQSYTTFYVVIHHQKKIFRAKKQRTIGKNRIYLWQTSREKI